MSKLVVNTIEPQVGFTSVTFNTNINTTSFNVTGISTFANIDINGSLDLDGTLNVTGVSTIGVSDKQIIFTTDGGLGAIQSASSSGFKIQRGTIDTININSGQVTIANHNLKVNNNSIVGSAITMYGATGIVSATAFYGDGSALTGIVSIPTGVVFYFASSSAPTGFLKANGASLNTTTYADLFAVIGYTYGGSGSSFNVPDLRGEFIRGWDDSRGVDSGRTIGSSQSDSTALPNNPFGTSNPGNHSHGYNGGNLKSLAGDSAGNDDYASGGGTTGGAGSHTHTINGGDSETRPRNVALLACIKY